MEKETFSGVVPIKQSSRTFENKKKKKRNQFRFATIDHYTTK